MGSSKSSSSSSRLPPRSPLPLPPVPFSPHQEGKCCESTAECAASTCVLCVCCPLATLWCCVKLPCKIAWRSARRLKECACCRGADHRILDISSSFSDMELNSRSSSINRLR